MEMIYCPECGKKTPFRDEFAGKNLKCSCGQTFRAPSKKMVSNQTPAIPPSSIQNPAIIPKPTSVPAISHGSFDPQLEKLIAIALKDGIVTDKERQILIKKAVELGVDVDEFEMELDSRIPTKSVDKPLMNIGNNNIVKANIKGGGNSGSGSGMPLMNIGNDNVINAKIDASTNVTHDNSLNVKGTYVAQQTVINVSETAISSMVKLLTAKKLTEIAISQIQDQIETIENPKELEITLAKTLRHMIRELKKLNKEGSESIRTSETAKLIDGIDELNVARLRLCHKILDKLHEIESNKSNKVLIETIEELDTCILNVENLFKRMAGNKDAKSFFGMGKTGMIIIGLLYWPIVVIKYFYDKNYLKKSKILFETHIEEAETVLNNLLEKNQAS